MKARTTKLVHVLLLSAICWGTYAFSLTGRFIWDDEFQIQRNSFIRDIHNLPKAFISGTWSFSAPDSCADRTKLDDPACRSLTGYYYRPIQTALFILGYRAGGLSPVYYHVMNVVLHNSATIFVYLFCLELAFPPSFAILAGMLFATHPIHTEAVAWIAAAGEVACGAFYFAALWAFVRFINTRAIRWISVSAGCFLLALWSKEMAVTLPVFALGLLITNKDRITRRMTVWSVSAFATAFAAYFGLRLYAVGSGTASLTLNLGPLDWITLAVGVLARYLWYMVIPFPLSAYHSIPIPAQARWLEVVLSTTAVAALSFLFWRYWKKLSDVAGWMLLFLISLAPLFYFKGLATGVFFSERYLYTPSLPAIVAGVLLLRKFNTKNAIAIGCSIAAIFLVVSAVRTLDWRDNETLYTRTLERNPDSAPFWSALGGEEIEKGNLDFAITCFNNALRVAEDPRYVHYSELGYRAHIGLGTIAARRKDFTSAKSNFQQAIASNPNGSMSYTYLAGVLMDESGNYSEAIGLLQRSIQLSPIDDVARDFMGVALFNTGRAREAIPFFEEALKINPDFKEARTHLQAALQRQ